MEESSNNMKSKQDKFGIVKVVASMKSLRKKNVI